MHHGGDVTRGYDGFVFCRPVAAGWWQFFPREAFVAQRDPQLGGVGRNGDVINCEHGASGPVFGQS